MRTIASIILAASYMATGCTGDVVEPVVSDAPAYARTAAPRPVPFRLAVTDGTSTGAPGGRCGAFPMITVTVEATGVGSHLGRSTVRQSHCQNAFDPTGAFFDGEFTDTGADGSSIIGTYEGHLEPTADPTLFDIVGQFEITGGTGRLEGVTGGGTASGTVDTVTGAASLLLVGGIQR